MKMVAPFDTLVIDLDVKDQLAIEEFIKQQEEVGGIDKEIGRVDRKNKDQVKILNV